MIGTKVKGLRSHLEQLSLYGAGLGLVMLAVALGIWLILGRLNTLAEGLLAAGLLLIGLFILARPAQVQAALTGRSARYSSNTAVMILAFLGILALVNFIANRHPQRVDLTELKQYTLSPATRQVLAELQEPVEITAFFSQRDRRWGDLEDLMREYQFYSDKIKFQLIDPDEKPALARQYNVTSYGVLIFRRGDKEQRIYSVSEQDITSAILKVSRERPKVIYFLTGHGERDIESFGEDGYSQIKRALEMNNYAVRSLNLTISRTVPADAAVLVIAAPKKPLLEEEQKAIRSYLLKAGKALVLQDPGNEAGLNDVLSPWFVRFGEGLVIDVSNSLLNDVASPVAARYPYSQITKDLPMTFLPHARPVEREEMEQVLEQVPGTPQYQSLIHTSNESWVEMNMADRQVVFNPGEDKRGPVDLAATVEADAALGSEEQEKATSRKTRLVVIGDSDFASNAFVGSLGNGLLFLNAINWLAEEEAIISIPPKQFGPRSVVMTGPQMRFVFYSSILFLPLLVALIGLIVWWQRR